METNNYSDEFKRVLFSGISIANKSQKYGFTNTHIYKYGFYITHFIGDR